MMTMNRAEPIGARPFSQPVTAYPNASLTFDLAVAGASLWFLAGLFLDGWAHNNVPRLESFFTPWHAVLYSGYFASALVHGFAAVRNLSLGNRWPRVLPRGYGWSLLGLGIFFVGGGADMAWHTAFGIERSVEALLSPTHLLLATGAFLFVTGPLRVAWLRPRSEDRAEWRAMAPVIISLLVLLSLLTFFTQYAHFLSEPKMLVRLAPGGDTFLFDLYGIVSVLIPTGIIMGTVLFTIRRWKLPLGTLTILLTVNSVLMFLMRFNHTHDYWSLLIGVLVAGLFADFLLWRLRPSPSRPASFRAFAFYVPFVLFLLYFLTLMAFWGVWWTIHMWLGVTFLAGITGLFISLLILPPALQEASQG